MKYLAIDYGLKRTGLAICDPSETFTSPLAVLQTDSNLQEKIIEAIVANQVESVVIGLPINMDDTIGPQAKIVQTFAAQLEKNIDIPIIFQDERLSSFAANEKIAAAEFTRKKKKKRLDAIAAAEILRFFLESKKQK